jgi:hypothetical protein
LDKLKSSNSLSSFPFFVGTFSFKVKSENISDSNTILSLKVLAIVAVGSNSVIIWIDLISSLFNISFPNLCIVESSFFSSTKLSFEGM